MSFQKGSSMIAVRHLSISNKLLSPRVQQPAPDFAGTAVIKGDFKHIKLTDYRGKYIVLYFYPLDL